MAWRGVHLSEAARLSLKDNALLIDRGDEGVRVPIEDIAFIVVDSPEITLPTTVLSALGMANVALVITDAKHLPCATLLPVGYHHRHSAIADLQRLTTKSLEGNLWKLVVARKILNQAWVLKSVGKDDTPLLAMASRVKPGDPDNIEARAAREYWSRLFVDFRRRDNNDARNMALNYGYAVMRSVVARACVAHGLTTAFGIKHANMANPFNLADDLMECFRPIVDLAVQSLALSTGLEKLDKETRQSLVALQMRDVHIGGTVTGIVPASDVLVSSFIRALTDKSSKELLLPELIE